MDETNELDSKKQSAQNKMIEGTFWLTAGNFISRLLGLIYIIPWYYWMGEHGLVANGLYGMGYNIYAMFLLISTAGIPSAITKQISYYNSLNDPEMSNQVFYSALKATAVIGVVASFLMYSFSSVIAKHSGGSDDLAAVIKSLSIIVIFFPSMSVIRGYFQGNHKMKPYAISQILEQVGRVLYMLLSTFIIMKVLKGNYVTAVVHSTFAAFIGLIFSYGYLLIKLKQETPIHIKFRKSKAKTNFSSNGLLKQIAQESIPFIIVGAGISLFKLIDQFTFFRIMDHVTDYSDKQLTELFGIFSANPDKLTMIVIALATSLSSAGLPLLTEFFTKKDQFSLSKMITNNIQLFLFIMLPSIIGMIALAQPLYTLFYEPSHLGIMVLIQACLTGFILGFYMLSSSILQSVNQNRYAIVALAVGALIKLAAQYPLISYFEVYGPLMATSIAFAVTCMLNLMKIIKIAKPNIKLLLKSFLLIFIISTLMLFVVALARNLLYLVLSPERKIDSFLIVVIVAVVGILFYTFISFKTGLADKLLGNDAIRIKNKFKINP
ncbi:polysaccharide biosynthesis protein [Carnobacterium sp. CS13]|uniref:putative polysaccharide biosynthesis protein n=1 Tax=Carnobacterium sp. CS13 TaxID=2800128 RepID=UPI0019132716|nr:polysaccharide biosynthesis protein [Carnobacterium sp. CS13]QQP70437.1 polysaccharide biosynthesis protein [Carnobacterium sp. CS13]